MQYTIYKVVHIVRGYFFELLTFELARRLRIGRAKIWTLTHTLILIVQVLLVTSSRRPELWIVPGGGVEPDEEPAVTAVREVLEEAGVIGTLGRCLGTFEVCDKRDSESGQFVHRQTAAAAAAAATANKTTITTTTTTTPTTQPTAATNTGFASSQNLDHKHRTEVFVMTVTEELVEWEDSRSIGRNRKWFTIDDALNQLALHKPTQRSYLQELRHSKRASDGDETIDDDVTAVESPASPTAQ